jgi:DNA-binding response OmpR family regulator
LSELVPRHGRVLIVEDDVMLRETLIWALEDNGFQVAGAIDGPDAVLQTSEEAPGLVVLDISLPGLDGFGVAAALRARYGGEVPILVITADGQPRQKAERVGAYAYLHKPFDVAHLVQRVREALPGQS